ncbi:Opr family porin [Arcobacter sp. YIC-80]|uniref:Opr family porin n=1 Tax=unclassified Arcobacter TaxID=2593671 RepID=UPI00385173F5
MKNLKISMIAALAVGACSVSYADSLQDALTNGKVSGEITTTYEQRDMDKTESTYYQNTGYAVGSFALKYETDTWNNLSLTSKFRAYKTLFEDDDNSTTSHGTNAGDASERFYEDGKNRTVEAEEFFLTYTPTNNITVKAGRQFISSNWVNKTQDAVKIDAAFGDTSLEAIWSLRHGRVYSRDYRPMSKFNDDKGVYQFTLSHKINDMISVSAYDAMYPDVRDIIGGKVNLKLDNVSLNAHYATSKEDKNTVKDSNFLHITASTSIAGFKPYAGYAKVDDDAAFPGYAGENSGETNVPFEEGDYFYSKGAETLYVGVSKSFGDLSATLLYGMTEYISGTKKLDMDETTLWLGYPLTKDLKANLGYTIVNETSTAPHGDYNQLNATLTYSF